MGKSTISMAIFNSYVKLPEGTMSFRILVQSSSITDFSLSGVLYCTHTKTSSLFKRISPPVIIFQKLLEYLLSIGSILITGCLPPLLSK